MNPSIVTSITCSIIPVNNFRNKDSQTKFASFYYEGIMYNINRYYSTEVLILGGKMGTSNDPCTDSAMTPEPPSIPLRCSDAQSDPL